LGGKDVANRDKIALILAGGKIISKYLPGTKETVALEVEELTSTYFTDEMREKVYVVDWSRQPVSHYTLRMCSDLIQMAGTQIEAGASGVVITGRNTGLNRTRLLCRPGLELSPIAHIHFLRLSCRIFRL